MSGQLNGRLAELDREIWGDDADDLGLDYEAHASALKPVVEHLAGTTDALVALGEGVAASADKAAAKIEAANQSLAARVDKMCETLMGGHSQTAEQLAEIMGEFAGLMAENNKAVVKALKDNDPAKVSDSVDALAKQLAESVKTQKSTMHSLQMVGDTMRVLTDRVSLIEVALQGMGEKATSALAAFEDRYVKTEAARQETIAAALRMIKAKQ